MNVPEEIANDYLIPKDYVKPDIAVGNYFLKWDADPSFGIPRNEIPELKRFIADLSLFLTPVFYEAANEIHRTAEQKVGSRETRRMDDVFSPEILASHKRIAFSYTLEMKRDGTAIINRTEPVNVSERAKGRTGLFLQWRLGELLFNRQRPSGKPHI